MARCIVRPRGKLSRETWEMILDDIKKGQTFDIWSGSFSEIPNKWADGKCSLRVKVGKKRKLVCGKIALRADGFDDEGTDCYLIEFTPNRPRSFGSV